MNERLDSDLEPAREEIDRRSGPVLLEFGADWCPRCQAIQSVLSETLAENSNVEHIRIEDGKGKPLGRSFRVKLWPTLVFMHDGRIVSLLVRPSAGRIVKGFEELRKAAAANRESVGRS